MTKRRASNEHLRLTIMVCVILRIAILPVVLLAVDAPAFAIQLSIEASTLAWAEIAIGPGESLVYLDPCKSRFEPSGFASS
jgi:hypothetical protein